MDKVEMKQAVELRVCCGTAAREFGDAAPLYEASPTPVILADLDLPTQTVPVRRHNAAIAAHEAAHEIMAIALGATPGRVTIDGQPQASSALPPRAPWRHGVAVLLAGPVAQLWARRWIVSSSANELAWFVRTVRDLGGGMCDHCRIARNAAIGLGHHVSDDAIVAEIVRIEALVVTFLKSTTNWRYVRRLADLLVERGTITGEEIAREVGPFQFDMIAFFTLNHES